MWKSVYECKYEERKAFQNLSLNYKAFLLSHSVIHPSIHPPSFNSSFLLLDFGKLYISKHFPSTTQNRPLQIFLFFFSSQKNISSFSHFLLFQNHPQFSLYVSKTDRVSLGSHLCPVLQKTVLHTDKEMLVIYII